MSLALELEGVPTVCPWEVQRDGRLNVIENAVVLWQLANSIRVRFSWLAMPCRRWTMTRKPMLRSLLHLKGEPWVAIKGVYNQVKLVNEGNMLIMFTAMYIMLLLRAQCGFALGNPLKSLAWWHPLLRWIAKQKEVICTFSTCASMGHPGRRPLVSYTTHPFCPSSKRNDNRRKNLLVLRGKAWYKGEWVFTTALACQYPPKLCKRVAELVGQYFREGKPRQANMEECCGIPKCGTVKRTPKRPCPDQGKWERCTRSRVLLEEDESEEEAVQKDARAFSDTPTLHCTELGSGNAPFVIDCADCPTGLDVQKQVTWVRRTDHPMMEFPKVAADTH